MDDIRLARAYLVRVAEPPAPALGALVAECGPVRAAALVRAGRVPDAVRDETSARREQDLAAHDLAAAAAVGARLVVPEDIEFRIRFACCPWSCCVMELDVRRVDVVLGRCEAAVSGWGWGVG